MMSVPHKARKCLTQRQPVFWDSAHAYCRNIFLCSLLLLTAIMIPISAFASSVYKSTDKDGKVTFSDKKSPDSEEIKVPPVQTFSPVPIPTTTPTQTDEEKKEDALISRYKILITQPENEAVFTSEVEDIKVKVFVDPKLHPEDRIVLKLNDQPFGRYQSEPEFSLGRLYRGTYKLQAFVYHKSGKGKPKGETEAIQFHQIREMIRAKPAPAT